MNEPSLGQRMLLGRLLTRAGDQAWDFAVPLVLLKILPGELRVVAFYYLLVKLATVIFLPHLSSVIDRVNRQTAAKLGIVLQLIGVILGSFSVFWLSAINLSELNWGASIPVLVFALLVFGGILSGLGSNFMDIAIANDLVPSSFDERELSGFNAKLRRVDLLTEVAAPIAAGFLLLVESPGNMLLGFYLVALWNVISFFPEYALLSSIFHSRPDLRNKQVCISASAKMPFFKKLSLGWRTFFRQPVAPAVLAYAVLWLSALSPHGVLLTAFLKDGWRLPEWAIGTFRGFGAVFGLVATTVYPRVIGKFGLLNGSRYFILFQTTMVVAALFCFYAAGSVGQIGFLVFILFSRVGLYGFSLGEMQIRQVGISANERGEVNGFANALTGVATLALFGAGTLLPSTDDFRILIITSTTAVILAATIFCLWAKSPDPDFRA